MTVFVMPNGKYVGKRITHIPVSYLRWMVRAGHRFEKEAQEELARRGTITPDVDLSGHAIDRFSLRGLSIWKKLRSDNKEGIYSWLCRVSKLALDHGIDLDSDDDVVVKQFLGIKFVFDNSMAEPMVKTVIPIRGKSTVSKMSNKDLRLLDLPDSFWKSRGGDTSCLEKVSNG